MLPLTAHYGSVQSAPASVDLTGRPFRISISGTALPTTLSGRSRKTEKAISGLEQKEERVGLTEKNLPATRKIRDYRLTASWTLSWTIRARFGFARTEAESRDLTARLLPASR